MLATLKASCTMRKLDLLFTLCSAKSLSALDCHLKLNHWDQLFEVEISIHLSILESPFSKAFPGIRMQAEMHFGHWHCKM